MSAPSVSEIFCGASVLPSDLDIFLPSPSTVKPCVNGALYGGRPFSIEEVSSEEWNQPRCWSEPSRYRSDGKAETSACEPRSTVWCVVPESNHTSSVSLFFRYMPASSPSSSFG